MLIDHEMDRRIEKLIDELSAVCERHRESGASDDETYAAAISLAVREAVRTTKAVAGARAPHIALLKRDDELVISGLTTLALGDLIRRAAEGKANRAAAGN